MTKIYLKADDSILHACVEYLFEIDEDFSISPYLLDLTDCIVYKNYINDDSTCLTNIASISWISKNKNIVVIELFENLPPEAVVFVNGSWIHVDLLEEVH